MTFINIFLMVGVTVTAVMAILIFRKLLEVPAGTPDTAAAVARIEAAAAKLTGIDTQIRRQSETTTGIEPVQP